MLEIAVNDCDAGRITPVQLIAIFQEAVDNGDILEEANEFCVVARVLPLIDRGALRSSKHVAVFEARMGAKATEHARKLRAEEASRATEKSWWQYWK
jgi:hypothetical protein